MPVVLSRELAWQVVTFVLAKIAPLSRLTLIMGTSNRTVNGSDSTILTNVERSTYCNDGSKDEITGFVIGAACVNARGFCTPEIPWFHFHTVVPAQM
mmetsp:Transcript_3970/g.6055  ORF Transcript_3970/g.6055 Transcript_3970/m.6055 type:complete len:97 (-) Transcript_3970:214-504(-)